MIKCDGCKFIEILKPTNAYCYVYRDKPNINYCSKFTPPIKKTNDTKIPKIHTIEDILKELYK